MQRKVEPRIASWIVWEKMKRKWLIGLIAYVGLVVICAVVVYVFPSVRGLLTSTYIAEPGEISLTENINGYIVRDEQVYVAARDYKVKRKAKTGTLYKYGKKAVELEKSSSAETENENKYKAVIALLGDSVKKTKDGVAQLPGYISFFVDGYEGILTTNNMKDIKMSEYKSIRTDFLTETAKGQCLAGDPLFKITKNVKWCIVFFKEKKDGQEGEDDSGYYEGDSMDITIGDVTNKAYVEDVAEGEHVYRIILKCGFTYKGYLKDRKINATITTASATGLLLESKSVVKKDGKKGVLAKDKLGNYEFIPVHVKADDGKNCIVSQDLYMDDEGNFVETIGIYEEIVARPTKKEIEEAA